jgi:hypothetical protein
LVTLGNIATPTGDVITDFQYALWNLFDSSIALNSNQITDQFNAAQIVTATSGANLVTTAQDAAKLVIYTAVPANSNQEFLGLNTPTSAPEPGTWAFMAGLGLLFLIPGIRSRARSAIARA